MIPWADRNKPAPLPERFKVKYTFKEWQFDYILPLTGVDVEFLRARRIEVKFCFAQLAERIGKINIVTSKGVAEMETAAKLTKYYFYASKHIERKYLELTTDIETQPVSESYEKHMREMHREKTI